MHFTGEINYKYEITKLNTVIINTEIRVIKGTKVIAVIKRM